MRLLALTALLLSTAPALAQDADALLARLLQDRGEDIDACFTDMPQMRDLHGLPELLRRLRNSGLRPRMFGDGLPMPDIPLPERTAAE